MERGHSVRACLVEEKKSVLQICFFQESSSLISKAFGDSWREVIVCAHVKLRRRNMCFRSVVQESSSLISK